MRLLIFISLSLLAVLGNSAQVFAQTSCDNPDYVYCSAFTHFPSTPKQIQLKIIFTHPDEGSFEYIEKTCATEDYYFPIPIFTDMSEHIEEYSWSILHADGEYKPIENYTVILKRNSSGLIEANPSGPKYIDMSAYDNRDYKICDPSLSINDILRRITD